MILPRHILFMMIPALHLHNYCVVRVATTLKNISHCGRKQKPQPLTSLPWQIAKARPHRNVTVVRRLAAAGGEQEKARLSNQIVES